MTAADTFDAASWLTGIVFLFWAAGQVVSGRAARKWRKVRRHQPRY